MGAAAGVCFALDAVFLRGLTAALSPFDRIGVLINLAGFAVASVLGNLVIQRGFQMAPLRHVLPRWPPPSRSRPSSAPATSSAST